MAVAPVFRLNLERARAVLAEVLSAAQQWREVAAAAGIDRRELSFLAPAFEGSEVDVARRIVNPTQAVGSTGFTGPHPTRLR